MINGTAVWTWATDTPVRLEISFEEDVLTSPNSIWVRGVFSRDTLIRDCLCLRVIGAPIEERPPFEGWAASFCEERMYQTLGLLAELPEEYTTPILNSVEAIMGCGLPPRETVAALDTLLVSLEEITSTEAGEIFTSFLRYMGAWQVVREGGGNLQIGAHPSRVGAWPYTVAYDHDIGSYARRAMADADRFFTTSPDGIRWAPPTRPALTTEELIAEARRHLAPIDTLTDVMQLDHPRGQPEITQIASPIYTRRTYMGVPYIAEVPPGQVVDPQ
jgi:hypothetical protein